MQSTMTMRVTQKYEIHPLNGQEIDIVVGVLNTPSGSCAWKTVIDTFYRIGPEDMSDDSLMCTAVFNLEPVETKFTVRTIDIDPDDKAYIYSLNNQLLYTMQASDIYYVKATAFALIYRTDKYTLQGIINIYDTNKYIGTGYHSVQVDDYYCFDVLAFRYLVIHNPTYFRILAPNDVDIINIGAYFTRGIPAHFTVVATTPVKIYFSVVAKPLVYCDSVEIYDGSDASFLIQGPDLNNRCILLTSAYVMDYYIYVTNLNKKLSMYYPNEDLLTDISGDFGFIAREYSIFIHIVDYENATNSVVCLEKCEILSPPKNVTLRNAYIVPFDFFPAVPYSKPFYRFLTGCYLYYIPRVGTEVYFNRYSIYVFHNPKSFTATGDGFTFLGDKEWVLNITDKRLTTTITRLPDATDRMLNISVFNYRKTPDVFPNCNSVDIVVMSPKHNNNFIASYGTEEFNGISSNISVIPNQKVCIWYVASSYVNFHVTRSGLDADTDFTLYSENSGQFNIPSKSSYIRSRSIIAKWTTRRQIDSDLIAAAQIKAENDHSVNLEKGGVVRGTRSYMDFPFALYKTESSIYNFGTSEPTLGSPHPDDKPKKKLTGVQIGLIVFLSVALVISALIVVVIMKKKNMMRDPDKKRRKEKEELSDIEEAEPEKNTYMSASATPNASATATVHSGTASPTNTITQHSATSSINEKKNPSPNSTTT